FSSGAASMSAYDLAVAPPDLASTIVIAAVSVVLPWSTWPIVPMLQCGLFRSNFSLAIQAPALSGPVIWLGWPDRETFPVRLGLVKLLDDFLRDLRRHRVVVVVGHRERRAALAHTTQVADVAEHLF